MALALIPGLVAGIASSVVSNVAGQTVYNEYLKNGLPIKSATDTTGMTTEAMLYCKTNIGGYFFDGFLTVDASIETEITSNPVETGASVVDHAYVKPTELTMVIRMSDVHQSLVTGQFTGGYSRSIEAWKVLKKIQSDRIPVMVHCRLGLFQNMLIKSLTANDTEKEYRGLYATVVLTELPVARVKKVQISSASQTVIETQMGQINAVDTSSVEDESILYMLGFGAGSNTNGTGSGFSTSVSSGGAGLAAKLTCYCYNCNDDGAGGWGTTATASGRVATVGITCAINRTTMSKWGLKLGDQIAINGVGTRRIDDVAGVQDIIDIYVPATGSVRHCKCAQNPISGKRTTFVKL